MFAGNVSGTGYLPVTLVYSFEFTGAAIKFNLPSLFVLIFLSFFFSDILFTPRIRNDPSSNDTERYFHLDLIFTQYCVYWNERLPVLNRTGCYVDATTYTIPYFMAVNLFFRTKNAVQTTLDCTKIIMSHAYGLQRIAVRIRIPELKIVEKLLFLSPAV